MLRVQKSTVAIAFLLVAVQSAFSQAAGPKEWLAEIERDIWLPFMEGVRTFNDSKYLDVHSKDYVRVDPASRLLLDRKDYDDDTVKMMANYKEQGRVISISVRFEDRIADGKSAFERGVNRVVMSSEDRTSRTFYGRFQLVSRKENGKWKMLTEYFPGPATAQDFDNASAIGDYSRFLCYMPYPQKKLQCL